MFTWLRDFQHWYFKSKVINWYQTFQHFLVAFVKIFENSSEENRKSGKRSWYRQGKGLMSSHEKFAFFFKTLKAFIYSPYIHKYENDSPIMINYLFYPFIFQVYPRSCHLSILTFLASSDVRKSFHFKWKKSFGVAWTFLKLTTVSRSN